MIAAAAKKVSSLKSLKFSDMKLGQCEEARDLIMDTAKSKNWSVTPEGRQAFERYISATAMENRAQMEYKFEIATIDGRIAALIETRKTDCISMLCVHPDYARLGIGSRLVYRAASACAVRGLKKLTTYVSDEDIGFYERVGFTQCGDRNETLGIPSTPYKLSMSPFDKKPPSKLISSSVELFVFSGTGNTLLVAREMSGALRNEGKDVRLRDMNAKTGAILTNLDDDTAIGLAFPVACFSTYPSVWRFIESMPLGYGREIFILSTCGGFSGGMQGPLGEILSKKGYRPVSAKFFIMPGNYGNKTIPAEKNAHRLEKALSDARAFASDLLAGKASWGGYPWGARFTHWLAQTRAPWNFFYRMFPILADKAKCTRCSLCVSICPAYAITKDEDGYPIVNGRGCESCQRCVGFCPSGALGNPKKPAAQYRAMNYEEFKITNR
ncbi:hypothetical protein FACS1894204_04680 [Synergistales bacterium]|nr:hypothetical protein FACS1894204_04680 [Synergistales bacterium]